MDKSFSAYEAPAAGGLAWGSFAPAFKAKPGLESPPILLLRVDYLVIAVAAAFAF